MAFCYLLRKLFTSFSGSLVSRIPGAIQGLRQGGISEEIQNDSCEKILTPTLKLAKLGRWHDSKRTGRPGWVVMWDGWFRLQDMVEGYPVMKSLDQEI